MPQGKNFDFNRNFWDQFWHDGYRPQAQSSSRVRVCLVVKGRYTPIVSYSLLPDYPIFSLISKFPLISFFLSAKHTKLTRMSTMGLVQKPLDMKEMNFLDATRRIAINKDMFLPKPPTRAINAFHQVCLFSKFENHFKIAQINKFYFIFLLLLLRIS